MAGKITLKNALANLPQKTDVDSIVATDASGNPVYIKKSDLAQVVAELIGINDTWYRWRGYTRTDDFNEIKTPGIYQIAKNKGTLNAPPIYGLLEILAGPSSTIIQRATESAGRIYYRAFRNSDGTWIPWREL